MVNSGDTVCVLASAALVLFMTPGLALFYGGMVRAKNVLSIMMQSFFCIAAVSILWALIGYSLAFGHSVGGEAL
jgi:Amt family ammonium transporter